MVSGTKKVILKFLVFTITMSFIILNLTGISSVSADIGIDMSEPAELKWYVMGNGDQPDISSVEDAMNKYLSDKINTTVSLRTFARDIYYQKLTVLIAAGESFDMCFTFNANANYNRFVSYGIFKDITDMLDTYAPKTKALLGENILKAAEVNGCLYAIPTYQKNIASSYGLLFNKSLAQKYKIDVSKIKKLQDLDSIFKNVKAKAPKVIDFYPLDTSGTNSVFFTLNNEKLYDSRIPGSVQTDGKSTKVINEYDTPQAKSLFSLMNKWYKQGYISKSSKDSEFFENNKNNILAFYSLLDPFVKENMADFENLQVLPVELTKPILSSSFIDSFMQAISATCENPERALMLLELVNTDEKLANMLNYGIEGTHYKKTGAKTVTLLPDAVNYSPGTDFIFGNGSIVYQRSDQTYKDWNKVSANVKRAVPSPLLGFSFNPDPVADKLARLDEIADKYFIDLSIGKLDPAVNLPKMNNEFKNSGLQKALSEMQKQVDAFVKAQKN